MCPPLPSTFSFVSSLPPPIVPSLYLSIHHCKEELLTPSNTTTITPSPISEEDDDLIFCAIYKDQFIIDSVVKGLPCKHIYHPDCILPWLSYHNSCPLYRFQFPFEQCQPEINDLFGDLNLDYVCFLGSMGGFESEMLANLN